MRRISPALAGRGTPNVGGRNPSTGALGEGRGVRVIWRTHVAQPPSAVAPDSQPGRLCLADTYTLEQKVKAADLPGKSPKPATPEEQEAAEEAQGMAEQSGQQLPTGERRRIRSPPRRCPEPGSTRDDVESVIKVSLASCH